VSGSIIRPIMVGHGKHHARGHINELHNPEQ
jgi:hypothetical protein